MYSKILIASDGSEGALRALSAALDLARRCKAELHMVCVEELPRFATSVDEVIEEKQEAERRFGAAIEQARAMAKARRVKLEPHILAGHVVPTVVDSSSSRASTCWSWASWVTPPCTIV